MFKQSYKPTGSDTETMLKKQRQISLLFPIHAEQQTYIPNSKDIGERKSVDLREKQGMRTTNYS